eukprot:g41870.t1
MNYIQNSRYDLTDGEHLRPVRTGLGSKGFVHSRSVLCDLFPTMHIEANINCAWQIINTVKDALWSARNLLVFQNKELTSTKCCRLACSKVQDYEKAFDRISHTDIRNVLSKMGFGEEIHNWIQLFYIKFKGFGEDYLKVLGISFREATACAKTWEEHIAMDKQKLGRREQQSLSLSGGKSLVMRCE